MFAKRREGFQGSEAVEGGLAELGDALQFRLEKTAFKIEGVVVDVTVHRRGHDHEVEDDGLVFAWCSPEQATAPLDELAGVAGTDRIRHLEALLENQRVLTRLANERAEKAEATLQESAANGTHPALPPSELIEAATRAGQGGIIRVIHRSDGAWDIHNPLLVDLESAAGHLSCSERTVRRTAKDHGIGISHEVGPRINLRALVASIEATAA